MNPPGALMCTPANESANVIAQPFHERKVVNDLCRQESALYRPSSHRHSGFKDKPVETVAPLTKTQRYHSCCQLLARGRISVLTFLTKHRL
ncbi:hypothetical protein WOLCODRAFT_141000 [Wolfiporia cocos MD-104 SS10]|uniref:Uncharacterized protein n=1 Tax=Wolfiporia cocos (strain MD-104) TaxID=742152 RepID=A0A2H3J9P9_WOLCO|nr:hypothetical protein WOLCODRAFT_141000 [Wolfiporia cocos MD-104 SS10]